MLVLWGRLGSVPIPRLPSRVQGAQPPPGVQRVPLFLKTSEGGAGGIAAQAKPDPPLKEGAGQNKPTHPQSLPPAAGEASAPPHLQNKNFCAMISPGSEPPARFSSSEPAAYILHWGLTTENPPVAGALREHPKGQDPPRKVGTGATAVVRHRLLGACRIHIVLGANHGESPCGRGAEGTTLGARPSEEGWDRSECRCKAQALWSHPATRRIRDSYATHPRQLRDASAIATRRLHDYGAPEEKKKQEYIQSKNEVEAGETLPSLPLACS